MLVESAPSFEQMSLGIQQAIQESGEDLAERDEAVLSTEHQMVNTWCWLNIRVKLACVFFCDLV